MLEIAALAIKLNEPCFSLGEYNLGASGRGLQRVQVIRVMRNDVITTFRRELGPAKKFTGDEFCLMGGFRDEITGRIEIVHTVDELLEMAEQLRIRPSQSKQHKGQDLVKEYREWFEKLEKARRAVSTFGHGRSIIRG